MRNYTYLHFAEFKSRFVSTTVNHHAIYYLVTIKTVGAILGPVCPIHRRSIILCYALSLGDVKTIGVTHLWILGKSIVSSVELHIGDSIVPLDASCLLQTSRNLRINLTEDGNLPLDKLLLGTRLHLARDVVDEALLGSVVEYLLPKRPWAVEIFRADFRQERHSLSGEVAVRLVDIHGARAELDRIDGRQVVGTGALVEEGHASITLEVSKFVGCPGSVDRKLLVVYTNAVTVGVWVREQPALQDRIRRGLKSWRQVSWVESNLLNLGKVVDGVLIEGELAHLRERKLLLGPHVREVEDVDLLLLPQLLGLSGCHSLDFDAPLGEITALDGLVQVLGGVVGRLREGVFLCDELGALQGLEVDLIVHPVAVLVDELESVSNVAVHEAVAVGNTAVTHQNHQLVD